MPELKVVQPGNCKAELFWNAAIFVKNSISQRISRLPCVPW